MRPNRSEAVAHAGLIPTPRPTVDTSVAATMQARTAVARMRRARRLELARNVGAVLAMLAMGAAFGGVL